MEKISSKIDKNIKLGIVGSGNISEDYIKVIKFYNQAMNLKSCDYFWYFSCGKRHRLYCFPRAVWVSKACEPPSDQFWLDINLCAFHRLLTLRCLCHIAYRLDGFSNLKALLR